MGKNKLSRETLTREGTPPALSGKKAFPVKMKKKLDFLEVPGRKICRLGMLSGSYLHEKFRK